MDGAISTLEAAVRLDELAWAIPRARSGEDWQEGLDLLAMAAGLKPVAMFGRGGAVEPWRALAREFALPMIETAPWEPAALGGSLPRWYLDATATRRARQRILVVARPRDALARAEALVAQGRVEAAAEAGLLGFPPCCVAAHHAAALAYEREIAERITRANPGDEARMARLVEAGAVPYVEPPAISPSRWTSVNLCDTCVASDDSPARRLEQAYRALATRLAYPANG
ncbi:MAG TPA: hypothetical protein VLV50_11795 [Stellaceae bacterium]|nr:hypothetical protein [Stellaceae bacterium]